MKGKDIKKQFKSKFGLEIYYWNDLNKDKTIRRFKITYIGNGGNFIDTNVIDQNINTYYDYFKNELGLTNIKIQPGNNWYNKQEIVIKVENI
jgi:hypothetical protein